MLFRSQQNLIDEKVLEELNKNKSDKKIKYKMFKYKVESEINVFSSCKSEVSTLY